MNLQEQAMAWFEAGYAVLAVGDWKGPYREGWGRFFTEKQTEEEARAEFQNGAWGVAGLLYPASPFVHLDFDGKHGRNAWATTDIELPETARNITQSGGEHLVFRTSTLLRESKIRVKRKVRLVEIACGCVDKDAKKKNCGVDLLLNGIAVLPGSPNYREDPDHPIESAVEIPDAIIQLALVKQKQEKETGNKTGDQNGKVNHGKRKVTACSLAGTMRARGMSLEAIRAALKADSEQRFDPPLEDTEIEDILKSAGKWEQGNAVEAEHLTDAGNARRFAQQHSKIIRYSHQRGQWLVWNGKRWDWDQSGSAVMLAKLTVRSIYGEAENESDEGLRNALAEHARKSENDARIRAMLHLAQSELPVLLDQLDSHPFLFNCQKGIINLETGELMPHDPELMLTKISPVEFDPDAPYERFFKFLDRIMEGNADLIAFLKVWFGYCLTADVREQAVAFFHGQGSNGKTTLLELMVYLMGDYASMAAPGLLMAKRNEQHPTEIADLLGRRLVITVETKEGKRFNESIFKWLSGGDPVKGRFMKQDFFQFAPTHKFTIAANHKPVVSDSTESFWRRMRLVPFNVQIPKEERDKGLGEKLKAEAPGILAWIVRGAVKWRKDGLPEPAEIMAATDEYRKEQDFLAPFIAECCHRCDSENDEAQVGKLYQRYTKWAQDNGEKPMSSKRLSAMMKERGYENYPRTNGKYYWQGLALTKEEEPCRD